MPARQRSRSKGLSVQRTCGRPFTATSPPLIDICSLARLAAGSRAARKASRRSLLCSVKAGGSRASTSAEQMTAPGRAESRGDAHTLFKLKSDSDTTSSCRSCCCASTAAACSVRAAGCRQAAAASQRDAANRAANHAGRKHLNIQWCSLEPRLPRLAELGCSAPAHAPRRPGGGFKQSQHSWAMPGSQNARFASVKRKLAAMLARLWEAAWRHCGSFERRHGHPLHAILQPARCRSPTWLRG